MIQGVSRWLEEAKRCEISLVDAQKYLEKSLSRKMNGRVKERKILMRSHLLEDNGEVPGSFR